MTVFAKVNRKRLWLLLSTVWIVVIGAYYWEDVAQGYSASFVAKADIERGAQAVRFEECLIKNNMNWFSLKAKYGEKCQSSARETCDRIGISIASIGCEQWASEDCLKQSTVCRSVYWATGEQIIERTQTADFKETIERIAFYLREQFSVPLKTAVFLMFAFPILIGALPRFLSVLWKWLTKG